MTLIPTAHPTATQIMNLLRSKRIDNLYHFTSVENLRSICEPGYLYSKHALDGKGLWPCPSPGGNSLSHDLDLRNNNWNFISLSFTSFTPMAYRQKQISHLCFLEIDPVIATYNGVNFCNTNAASTNEQMRKEVGLQGLQLVNLDVMTQPPDPSNKNGWFIPVQAEILVPYSLSLELVKRIVFVSEASLATAVYKNQGIRLPQFQIDPTLFSAFSNEEGLSFPHVRKFIATTTYEGEKCPSLSYPITHISRSNESKLGIIAQTYARPGISATVYQDDVKIGDCTFMRENTYLNYVSISTADLPLGMRTFKYSLRSEGHDITWGITQVNVLP